MSPLLLLLACPPEEAARVVFTEEELEGELEGYEDWAHPVGWVGLLASCEGSHGTYARIWVNATAAEDLSAGAETFSDGAILIEEAYQDLDETFKSLVVMRKVTGFAPDDGDWFWAQYDEDGVAVMSGAVAACAACHEAGDDFVRHVSAPSAPRADACVADEER